MTDGTVPFGAIERSWNPAAMGRGAAACFEDLIHALRAAVGPVLDAAGLTQIGAAMWSALDNRGKPPQGEEGRLADALGRHWPLISRTILGAAEIMERARVVYPAADRVTAPLAIALAWRLMWCQWSDEHGTLSDDLEAERPTMDEELVLLFRFLVASPDDAGWPSERLELLAEDWSDLKHVATVADAVGILLSRSRLWRGSEQ